MTRFIDENTDMPLEDIVEEYKMLFDDTKARFGYDAVFDFDPKLICFENKYMVIDTFNDLLEICLELTSVPINIPYTDDHIDLRLDTLCVSHYYNDLESHSYSDSISTDSDYEWTLPGLGMSSDSDYIDYTWEDINSFQ